MSRVFFGHSTTTAQTAVANATALTFTIPSPTLVKGAISRFADAVSLTLAPPSPTLVKTLSVVADAVPLTFTPPSATLVSGAVSRVADPVSLSFSLPDATTSNGAAPAVPAENSGTGSGAFVHWIRRGKEWTDEEWDERWKRVTAPGSAAP